VCGERLNVEGGRKKWENEGNEVLHNLRSLSDIKITKFRSMKISKP
jgi:hypothetical protein